MKKEFLKMAGVENEKDFYKLFPTEETFFGMYPEARKLVQKKYGGLIKAKGGFGVTGLTTAPSLNRTTEIDDPSRTSSNFAATPIAINPNMVNPNIVNPLFRRFSGNLKFNWGDPKNRNVFSYGLTKEKENPYYSHKAGLSLNNLFSPGRGSFNLTGGYTPKTGEYNAGFNFGLPSRRTIAKDEPKSNFNAGFNIMRNDKGRVTRTAEVDYNTRLGNKKSSPTLSVGVDLGYRYGGGLIKAVGGFNVTDLSTKPSMNCSKGSCQMNTDDYSWIKQNQKIKPPPLISPWEAITWNKGEFAEDQHAKIKKEWEQNKNLYANRYPNLTYDEFYAANELERYNRLNQGQYNNYFDAQGNPVEGMDARVYSAQPYIPWARAAFNTPTPSREAILDYFQTHKLNKDDIKNFVNDRYTFPKEHMVAPPYFRMGGGLMLGKQGSKKKRVGQLNTYNKGGFVTTEATTRPSVSESDKQLLDDVRNKKIAWYSQRVNHPDPRISSEARQALELLNKFPADPSKDIKYTDIPLLQQSGVVGLYQPYERKMYLADPYKTFDQQVKSYYPRGLRNPGEKDELKKYYDYAMTSEPRSHEGEHYYEHPILDNIVNKYNNQIFSQYADPDVYRDLLYERVGKPEFPKKRDQYAFDLDANHFYKWMTGTDDPRFGYNKRKGVNKHFTPAEMYRALNDIRTEYNIDASKNTSPEDFKTIYEKVQQSYKDAKEKKDKGAAMRYGHMLDLFYIHGNDFEKINNLNNLLVRDVSSDLPVADEGFIVTTDVTSKSPSQITREIILLGEIARAEHEEFKKRLNATKFSLSNPHLATLPSSEDMAAARRLDEQKQFYEENPNAGTMARGDNTVLVKNFPVTDPITGRLIQPQKLTAPAWAKGLSYEAWDIANQPGFVTRLQRNPLPLWAQLLDPTGVSNYGNVKTSYEDMVNSEGFCPKIGNSLLFGLDVLSSIPIIGKVPKVLSGATKGSKAVKGASKASKVAKVAKPNVAKEIFLRPITNIDRFTGANNLFRLSSNAPTWLNRATNLTNSFNRGRRYFGGLYHGGMYGLDALSNLGSQNQPEYIPSGVGTVDTGYTDNQEKIKKIENDSLYASPGGDDEIVTFQLPDGRVVKMSSGSKPYADLMNRIDSYDFDDKKNMFIIKKYKK